MAHLFRRLDEISIYQDWADLFDWLFDDNRFKNWTSGYVGSLAKKIKRLPHVGNNTYRYAKVDEVVFPTSQNNRTFCILMTRGDGEAKDLIRHIRNGIAHGNAKIVNVSGERYIEILDYSKGGRQSAYLCIPVSYIQQIYQLYEDVNRGRIHNRH